MTSGSAPRYFSLAELSPGYGDSRGYSEPEEVRRTEGKRAGVVERRSIFRVVCFLQRRGRAVSQPGHIAEGGNSAGLSAETADKEAQNNESSLCLSNGPRKKKKRHTRAQTTSTGRHAAAPLSHILSQTLRNPQTCSIDQIRTGASTGDPRETRCSFD